MAIKEASGFLRSDSLVSLEAYKEASGECYLTARSSAVVGIPNPDTALPQIKGSQVLDIINVSPYIIYVIPTGVYVYSNTDLSLLSYCILNITCAAYIENRQTPVHSGLYIGSVNGIYKVTKSNLFTPGVFSPSLTYTTASTPALNSSTITSISGSVNFLLAATAVGLNFINLVNATNYTASKAGVNNVDINGAYMAFISGGKIYRQEIPTANFSITDATAIPNVGYGVNIWLDLVIAGVNGAHYVSSVDRLVVSTSTALTLNSVLGSTLTPVQTNAAVTKIGGKNEVIGLVSGSTHYIYSVTASALNVLFSHLATYGISFLSGDGTTAYRKNTTGGYAEFTYNSIVYQVYGAQTSHSSYNKGGFPAFGDSDEDASYVGAATQRALTVLTDHPGRSDDVSDCNYILMYGYPYASSSYPIRYVYVAHQNSYTMPLTTTAGWAAAHAAPWAATIVLTEGSSEGLVFTVERDSNGLIAYVVVYNSQTAAKLLDTSIGSPYDINNQLCSFVWHKVDCFAILEKYFTTGVDSLTVYMNNAGSASVVDINFNSIINIGLEKLMSLVSISSSENHVTVVGNYKNTSTLVTSKKVLVLTKDGPAPTSYGTTNCLQVGKDVVVVGTTSGLYSAPLTGQILTRLNGESGNIKDVTINHDFSLATGHLVYSVDNTGNKQYKAYKVGSTGSTIIDTSLFGD